MPAFTTSKFRLSFGYIYVLNDFIAEIIVDNGIELTLDMAEEYDNFLSAHLKPPFGVLINRINFYTLSFEAQLVIGSIAGLKAIAVVQYDAKTRKVIKALLENRRFDNLNLKQFSGIEFGRSEGLNWLKSQLRQTSHRT